MKGIGIGLMMTYVMVAVVVVVGVVSFGSTSFEAAAFTCETSTIEKIINWGEKMSLASAIEFPDDFLVMDCVDYIESEGIKFKSDNQINVFTIPGSNKNIEFVIPDGDRIIPSDISYDVTITPPNKIVFKSGGILK